MCPRSGMGKGMGAAFFPYPKWVWTPAGGWYCLPKHWKRNTAIMAGVWVFILANVFRWSAANERRLMPPPDNMCAHTARPLPARPARAGPVAPPLHLPSPPQPHPTPHPNLPPTHTTTRRFPIPSQSWCKHAAEDDPRLQKE